MNASPHNIVHHPDTFISSITSAGAERRKKKREPDGVVWVESAILFSLSQFTNTYAHALRYRQMKSIIKTGIFVTKSIMHQNSSSDQDMFKSTHSHGPMQHHEFNSFEVASYLSFRGFYMRWGFIGFEGCLIINAEATTSPFGLTMENSL